MSDPSSPKRSEASASAESSHTSGSALGLSPGHAVPAIVVLPSTPIRSTPAQFTTPSSTIATPGTPRGAFTPAANAIPQSTPIKASPRGIPLPAPLDERLNVTDARKKLVLTKEKVGSPMKLSKRPGFTNLGREAKVNVNCYKVMKYPSQVIWQYDVQIGNGAEKRGLITAVWGSQRVSTSLTTAWIFDGNQLAWYVHFPV